MAGERNEVSFLECRLLVSLYKRHVCTSRSNHAGESGAVYIYKGALFVFMHFTRDQSSDQARRWHRFITEHCTAEQRHLDYLEALDCPRSVFTPLWRLAGFTLGVLPSLISPRCFYMTTVAVEEFVEEHYGYQINRLQTKHPGEYTALLDVLVECCADEVHHRNEAAALFGDHEAELSAGDRPALADVGVIGSVWQKVVRLGSQAAVVVAKRL